MKNNLNLQYNGVLDTPNLWLNSDVYELEQFLFDNKKFSIVKTADFKEIRLGKRVEEFLSFQFSSLEKITILKENLQIKDEKITIGELDFLLQNETENIHLEVVYKFYLYDPNIKIENTLDVWIGPNRKDSLIYKLRKIKEKQLPLLYSDPCTMALRNLNIDVSSIKQYVCYKAQLFLPLKTNNIDIKPLNEACVVGFYISHSEIEKLQSYQFFIPKKIDWLVTPHLEVNWKSYDDIRIHVTEFIDEKRSPMVWLKSTDNKLSKCFITFW